ncbi:MAG: hypothetical protein WKF44_07475, partial [Rubrobacteraceae bacterium]
PQAEPKPPSPEPPREERPPDPEPPSEAGEANGGARANGRAVSGDDKGDDIIRDQREVFEMARELGLFGPDGGS